MTHAHESYPAGVPCWVETMQPDPEATGAFYAALLGWELVDSGDDDPFAYVVARLRGQDVAGIGRGDVPAAWITHVRVERAETAAERTLAAGGAVLAGPIDADPAGRFVVLADPAGRAVLRLGGRHPGGRGARQRAGRVGHERAGDQRSRGQRRVLPRRLRLGGRSVRAGAPLPPAGLCRGNGGAAGAARPSWP